MTQERTGRNIMDKEIEITLLNGSDTRSFSKFFPPRMRDQIECNRLSALGAIVDGVACGAIVYDFDYGAIDIKSLCVAPGYRRQKIGTTLFCEVVEFFEQVSELDVQTVTVEYSDDGTGAYEFFRSLGFEQQRHEEKTVSVRIGELSSGIFAERASLKGTVFPLSQLSPAHLRGLDAELDRRGANFTGESLASGGVLADLSMAYYENNEPGGCVCFSQGSAENELILSVFFIGTQSIAAIMAMLSASLNAIRSNRGEDVTVRIPLVMPSAVKLAQRLLGKSGEVSDTLCSGVFALGVLNEEDGE